MDAHPEWLAFVLVGAVAAVAMAVFGLPPIAVHEPLHYVGVMDPFCGMTRAVRFLARGDLRMAWRYNPGSIAIATAAGLVVARSFVGAVSGRWALVTAKRTLVTTALVFAAVALEINQQAHAALLR